MRNPTPAAATSSPLAHIARDAPPWLGVALSTGGRLAGAALAIYLAQDQSYDRTQVLSVGVALIALGSFAALAKLPLAMNAFLPALASGVLFFGGALLWDQAAGVLMLIVGVGAIIGVLLDNHRSGIEPGAGVGGFFFGLGAAAAIVVLILLAAEAGWVD